MITEAIILAGGLGTRLKSAVPELPKCMAPVNGKPFIAYVIDHFQQQGITDFIFALGYKSEAFESFLFSLSTISYQLSTEHEPLGTGGAIKLACSVATSGNVIVTNGDTLYKADLGCLSKFHSDKNADCTICLKPMEDFDRYGVVEVNEENRIISFKEKQHYDSGYISAGLYALDRNKFLQEQLPVKFSFEKDYMEALYSNREMFGHIQDEYFIDIGIPGDYLRAQADLAS
jgi:D-glycero-alpha-D-manno-heptose 1-phosphate guanylyltransferase